MPQTPTKTDVVHFLTNMEKTIGRENFKRIFQVIKDYKSRTIDIHESINRMADLLAPYPHLMESNSRFFPRAMMRRVKERAGTTA